MQSSGLALRPAVAAGGRGRGRIRCDVPPGDHPVPTNVISTPGQEKPIGTGRGRGGRSRVNWTGDAARSLSDSVVAGIAATPTVNLHLTSNTWQVLESRIFGGPLVEPKDQNGSTGSTDNLLNLRWEPAERDCYMRLANMLKSGSSGANKFSQALAEFLNSRPDPFLSILMMSTLSGDFRDLKGRSFTAHVLAEADRWQITREKSSSKKMQPDVTIQDTAFHLYSRHKNAAVLRSACRVFQLPGRRYLQAIYQLAAAGEFKQACDCACSLGIYDAFDARVFCLPLLLEERLTTAEAYLEGSPQTLRGLMTVLDELSEPSANRELIAGLCASYPQLDVRANTVVSGAEKLTGKPLGRLIRRYAERFGLDLAADMPKFSRRAAQTDLRFWIREFYEGSGSKDLTLICWRELLEKKVAGDLQLQEELVDQLLMWDRQEAGYWATQLGITTASLTAIQEIEQKKDTEENWINEGEEVNIPSSRQRVVESVEISMTSISEAGSWSTDSVSGSQTAEEEEDATVYYQLPPTEGFVVYVDTLAGFELFLSEGLCDCCELGLDVEYSTTHLSARVSLLQLANGRQIFVLDMEVLPGLLAAHHWSALRNRVFCNPDVALVGYGVRGDLKLLSKSWPNLLGGLETDSRAVVSLEILKPRLALPLQLPPVDQKGLSGLTAAVLGRPLKKSEQISDWSRRPLRPSQVMYAALDAHVGLEIFVSLRQRAREKGVLEMFVRSVTEMAGPAKKSKPEKTGASKDHLQKVQDPKDIQPFLKEPIPPASLRVVCDTMLQGLCKKLRMCGVDAVALENGQRHEDCLTLANNAVSDKTESGPRYVISRGAPALQLAKQLPAGHCLAIRSELVDDQMDEVFRYFNVVATGGDLFSRCVICNGARYLLLSSSLLLSLHELHVKRTAGAACAGMSQLTVSSSRQQTPSYGVDSDEDVELEDDYGLSCDNDDAEEQQDDFEEMMQIRPRWCEVEGGRIDMNTGMTDGNVLVDVSCVARAVIEKITDFWICASCGKVYWQGSHWERAQDRVKSVLGVAPNNFTTSITTS